MMTSLFILLTKGGLGGGDAGGGLFLILILLGLFILFGYILTHAAGGILGILWLFYDELTKGTSLDKEYDGPLSIGAKYALISLGVASWLAFIIVPTVRDTDTSGWYIFWCTVYPFIYGYIYIILRHFYFRHLYKIGTKKAKQSLVALIICIIAIFLLTIFAIAYTSPSNRVDRFNAILSKAQKSELIESECIEGFRLGMPFSEYCDNVDRLINDSLLERDSTGEYLFYNKYNTEEYNNSKLYLEPVFCDGHLSQLAFSVYNGMGDKGLTLELHSSGRLVGFKKLVVPELTFTSDGDAKVLEYSNGPDQLYNYYANDELFLKDNMLIVISVLQIKFINMRDL